MRLKTIKLSGFKSFVDPTTVPASSNLIGIVGPNGCGKSNIIDAIRWVMGESSARNLRGDSMADVIFNGSSARKPVGQASVELLLDNSNGSVGGQYARYAEISIRREAARDGRSEYFLNKTRCRRKDITDLLLGTGLGPRAYSIIEQDMVSRIVEAKPEDLRAFFEEAAGISKYKERRRETENRMRHTRENLARVEDIRNELAAQLRRLRRQSRAAAKFKELKGEERLARGQWLALRWRALDELVQQADRAIAAQENKLEHAVADQREIEAKIERIRSQQTEASEQFNKVQGEFYSVGAEIASLEQAIEHARETHSQRVRELEQVTQAWAEAGTHLQSDLQRLKELAAALEQGAPAMEDARRRHDEAAQATRAAEQKMRDWQERRDAVAEAATEPAKVREIQRARIAQLDQHIEQLRSRQQRLADETSVIEAALAQLDVRTLQQQQAQAEAAWQSAEQQLQNAEAGIKQGRGREAAVAQTLEALQGEQHRCDARLASLRELQAAAEGRHDAALNEWLSRQRLETAPRLAGLLSVEPGWERAVERVLGVGLAAVCVRGLEPFVDDLEDDDGLEVALLDLAIPAVREAPGARARLLDKVQADANLTSLLASVYVSENLKEALTMRATLATHEVIVTRSGTLVGQNWLRLASEKTVRAGMLVREREIEQLQAQSRALREKLANMGEQRAALQTELERLEHERERYRERLHAAVQERSVLQERCLREEAKHTQLKARAQQVTREQQELSTQLERDCGQHKQAQVLLQQAEGQAGTQEELRQELLVQRDGLQAGLEQARQTAIGAQETLHRLEVEREGKQAAFTSTRQSVSRLENQLQQLVARRDELQQIVSETDDPGAALRERLDTFLRKRLEVENRLNEARTQLSELDAGVREQERARAQQEQHVQELRQGHEEARVQRQDLIARRDALTEQIVEAGLKLETLVAELPADATEQAWQARLEDLHARIERLGAINLVAIEEYEEQSERKQYLDKQHADLTEALATLEEAIRKMDRETRARFKETFDRVNSGFQSFFPRLFGGGSAYLELTESDLLSSGVTVMARPPGKRNSTIHLLSGGEKALTAVALLFALFELNPAPFCLLDEVDAPLDDANVERYCETLAVLSEKTQLIYVTHNKITMETAKNLIGVTMTEPGVSRLVAVDVDEALEMAAR